MAARSSGPDPELVHLIESGKFHVGRAIDLGCGPDTMPSICAGKAST